MQCLFPQRDALSFSTVWENAKSSATLRERLSSHAKKWTLLSPYGRSAFCDPNNYGKNTFGSFGRGLIWSHNCGNMVNHFFVLISYLFLSSSRLSPLASSLSSRDRILWEIALFGLHWKPFFFPPCHLHSSPRHLHHAASRCKVPTAFECCGADCPVITGPKCSRAL